jgi:hypothetical protein
MQRKRAVATKSAEPYQICRGEMRFDLPLRSPPN